MKQKLGIGLWVALMLLMCMGVVYAAYPVTTIDKPATDADMGAGLYNANFTLGAPTDNRDNLTLHNCTWSLYSVSTGNTSSAVVLYTNASINITGNTAIVVRHQLNTALVEDANDYSLKVTCIAANDTSLTSTDTNTGLDVDNTIPTSPSSYSPADGTKDTDGDVSFSVAVTGARTTACTMFFKGTTPGKGSYSMTHSGATCTASLSGMPNSVYEWYVTATDGTNSTTTSTTTTLQIDQPSVSPGMKAQLMTGEPQPTDEGVGVDGGIPTTTIVAFVVLVAVVIYFMKYKK